MTLLEIGAIVLVTAGAVFFLAGTVGVLRFPDAPTRLHAVTKADNLGLGLLALGLALLADSPSTVVKLLLIWVIALAGSATACQLIANAYQREEQQVTPDA
jgi:multicomponent Na+:H+ antiporter subunit G